MIRNDMKTRPRHITMRFALSHHYYKATTIHGYKFLGTIAGLVTWNRPCDQSHEFHLRFCIFQLEKSILNTEIGTFKYHFYYTKLRIYTMLGMKQVFWLYQRKVLITKWSLEENNKLLLVCQDKVLCLACPLFEVKV